MQILLYLWPLKILAHLFLRILHQRMMLYDNWFIIIFGLDSALAGGQHVDEGQHRLNMVLPEIIFKFN